MVYVVVQENEYGHKVVVGHTNDETRAKQCTELLNQDTSSTCRISATYHYEPVINIEVYMESVK